MAWDPFGNGKTSVRAGFGIAYNLLDNIGWCCQATNPKFSTFAITSGSTPASYPITVAPGGALSIPGLLVQTSSSGGGVSRRDHKHSDNFTANSVRGEIDVLIRFRLIVEQKCLAGSLPIRMMASGDIRWIARLISAKPFITFVSCCRSALS